MKHLIRTGLTCLAFLGVAEPLLAQGRNRPATPLSEDSRELRDYILANYTKYEHRIPMRDGKKLFTAVYAPKDDSKQYPILMMRTPYSCSPYGIDKYRDSIGPSSLFVREGYIIVYQDVRGRWMSEGEFENMRPHNPNKKGSSDIDESSDTYDTVEWLVKHVPNNNGRVGQWGISYPGFYTAAGMIDAHPAVKAVSPQAPVTDWFVGDDFHHNGAFFLPHCFNFMSNFGKPRPQPTSKYPYPRFEHGTPDGYDFFLKLGSLANADKVHFKGEVAFWNEMMKHGTYDEFWKSRNIRQHLKNIKPAVMTVGGWFDAENLFGALEVYKHIKQFNPDKQHNTLVMGPWVHGGWSRGDGENLGNVKFNAKTVKYYQETIEFPFFQHHLKEVKPEWKAPEAWIFETGTNQWRKYDVWPPKQAKAVELVFSSQGRLLTRTEAEKTQELAASPGFDEYISDPNRPVPYIDRISVGMEKEYMIADQRFASRRPDVLTLQSDPLTSDMTIAGPLEVELTVSTTGTDADWVVKLIDVYPDDANDPEPNPANVRMGGYQQLVRGDVMRGKFRNSLERPEPFEPGKPTKVKFIIPDTCHTFRPGHRIMIHVQSSWFPLVDRNPQTFGDIYHAKDSDFQKATHRVYHSPQSPSKITVKVLQK
jgi:putative CocE/NonD family hydrolase